MEDKKKLYLFEQAPVSKAVVSMAVPTVISSLVMVIYNLADTYFVGMLNNPVENAAVTLAAPVLLAFNAVNNLFGVGSSSMMSRALGSKKYDMVRKVSAFGFYCTVFCSLVFSILCTVGKNPLLALLGTDVETFAATGEYLKWTVCFGAVPAILNVVMAYMVRSHPARQYRYDERMFAEYSAGSVFYPALGAGYGGGRSRARHVPVQLCCMYVFFHTFIYKTKKHLCMHSSEDVPVKERNHCWRMRGGDSRRDPESAQCDRYDSAEQFYFFLRGGCGGGDGDCPENQYGSHECCLWLFTGHHAADQLQLCFR